MMNSRDILTHNDMENIQPLADFYRHDGAIVKYLFDYNHKPAIAGQSSVSNGALRLTGSFTQLLEKQFPFRSATQKMKCRFPVDFAAALFVHVNHLNRCLKDTTGKTTSQLIAARMMKEAYDLLETSEWNICEIGWCLGFDEVPHFINFFKKAAGMAPNAYRKYIRLINRDILKLI